MSSQTEAIYKITIIGLTIMWDGRNRKYLGVIFREEQELDDMNNVASGYGAIDHDDKDWWM